jgi:hypothetical protein
VPDNGNGHRIRSGDDAAPAGKGQEGGDKGVGRSLGVISVEEDAPLEPPQRRTVFYPQAEPDPAEEIGVRSGNHSVQKKRENMPDK